MNAVRKAGDDFMIPIPLAVARKVGLKAGTAIDLEVIDGCLCVRRAGVRRPPRRRSKYKLSDILRNWKGPTPHKKVFDDPPVGKELI
jgi:antitoxin component of MazEF toxin-antitoxin module